MRLFQQHSGSRRGKNILARARRSAAGGKVRWSTVRDREPARVCLRSWARPEGCSSRHWTGVSPLPDPTRGGEIPAWFEISSVFDRDHPLTSRAVSCPASGTVHAGVFCKGPFLRFRFVAFRQPDKHGSRFAAEGEQRLLATDARQLFEVRVHLAPAITRRMGAWHSTALRFADARAPEASCPILR